VACPEFNVTRQLNGEPDCNVFGAQASPTGLIPTNESVACADEGPRLALNCAWSSWSTSELMLMNGAVVLPAAGCTNGGTLTCVLLEESWMLTPAGTAPESPIWQALVPPPVSVDGLQEIDVIVTFVFTAASRVSD
jgi:hypothetical protein